MCRDVCSTVQDDVFFFNDTATTEIYTLSLHDALPILIVLGLPNAFGVLQIRHRLGPFYIPAPPGMWTYTPHASTRRSEEHTSELQSRQYLVCRLLLEKKNKRARALHRHRRGEHGGRS